MHVLDMTICGFGHSSPSFFIVVGWISTEHPVTLTFITLSKDTISFPIYTTWYSYIVSMPARHITYVWKEVGNHNWPCVILKFMHQRLCWLQWSPYIPSWKEHMQTSIPVETNKSGHNLERIPLPAPPVMLWSWALSFLSEHVWEC